MKKLIALMMCAMLLLSGCSAVTAEGPGMGLRLSDPVLTAADGTAVDLTGLSATFEAAQLDTGAGARISIAADGQQTADIILATVGQYLYLSLPGTQGPRNYAFDLNKALMALSNAYDAIVGAIDGIIPSIFTGVDDPSAAEPAAAWSESEMTDEELEQALAELEAALAELEEEGYAPEAEDGETYASVPPMSAAEQEIANKVNEILTRCMTQEVQQIDGEDFQVIGLNITEADMAELLDTIQISQLGISFGQYMTSYGISMSLLATVTGNQDFSKFNVDCTPTITVEDQSLGLNIIADNMDGDSTVNGTLAVLSDGQSALTLSLSIASTVAQDAGWLPGELPLDTIVLTDLSPNGAENAIAAGFEDCGTALMNMLSALTQG